MQVAVNFICDKYACVRIHIYMYYVYRYICVYLFICIHISS